MKYNLKKLKKELLAFPSMVKDPTSNEQDAITWHWNFLHKFNDFEAELRERLAEEDAIKKRYGPTMIRAFTKEILGDK